MRIYNLTDHPSKTSISIRLRGGEIKPGQSIETEYDPKLEKMKEVLAIGTLPNWYKEWKESLLPKATSLLALKERFKAIEEAIEERLSTVDAVILVKETPTKKK